MPEGTGLYEWQTTWCVAQVKEVDGAVTINRGTDLREQTKVQSPAQTSHTYPYRLPALRHATSLWPQANLTLLRRKNPCKQMRTINPCPSNVENMVNSE